MNFKVITVVEHLFALENLEYKFEIEIITYSPIFIPINPDPVCTLSGTIKLNNAVVSKAKVTVSGAAQSGSATASTSGVYSIKPLYANGQSYTITVKAATGNNVLYSTTLTAPTTAGTVTKNFRLLSLLLLTIKILLLFLLH